MMLRSPVLAIFLCMPAVVTAAGTHSVLLIHSYHSGLPWTDAQQKGFAETLRNSGLQVNLYLECPDSLRYRDSKETMRDNLARALGSKFEDNPPDVIAATDNNALDFILAERPFSSQHLMLPAP